MTSRIWELHAQRLDGAIRSTPDGEANIGGLVLSEKAYLLAMRDHRPEQLVRLVQTRGPSGGPSLVRSDEVSEPVVPPARLPL